MKTTYRTLFAAAFFMSLSLPAFAGSGSTAVREGSFGRSPSNYVGTGTTSPRYGVSSVPTSSADFVFAPGTGNFAPGVPYPRWEAATPSYQPVNPGNDPFDNPAQDLPTREEMERAIEQMSTPVGD